MLSTLCFLWRTIFSYMYNESISFQHKWGCFSCKFVGLTPSEPIPVIIIIAGTKEITVSCVVNGLPLYSVVIACTAKTKV